MLHRASSSSPRYLLAGRGADVSALRAELEPIGPFEVVESPAALLNGSAAREPGWILVPPEVEDSLVMDLLPELTRREGTWSVLLVERGDRGLRVLPLSPGFVIDVVAAASRLEAGGAEEGLLSFRHSLRELSRIRHDINNPLTAALAETQLVLMDLEPGTETRASVRAVEEQLRRIRDLVEELTAFSVPAPPSG